MKKKIGLESSETSRKPKKKLGCSKSRWAGLWSLVADSLISAPPPLLPKNAYFKTLIFSMFQIFYAIFYGCNIF